MSYLKNLAESLSSRVVPGVSRSVFGSEHNKLADFNEKLNSAKEVFAKAKTDVATTGEAFAGIGPVSRQLRSQLRSGKFGTSKEDEDKAFMKSMGLDALDNLEIGGDEYNTEEYNTTNHNTINQNFSVNGPVADGLTKGDALLNERLTVNNEISSKALQNITGLTSSMAYSLNALVSFHRDNTAAFYETSLENTKLGAAFIERFEPMLDNIKDYFSNEAKKREEEAARRELGKTGGDGLDSVLDPEAMLKKFTTGNFEMMFGEMSPIRSMLEGASKDPLGTLTALGLGGLVTSIFTSQVDFIKNTISTIEYKIQGTLENWAGLQNDPANPSMFTAIKRKLGEMLKADRDTSLRLTTGAYGEEATFDGQTRKAIIDVIPMYLSKILKAVSGAKDHEVYDYQSGRFKTGNTLNRQNQKELARIDRGYFAGGLGNELKYGLMENESVSKAERTRIEKEVFRKSMGENSHNLDISKIELSTPELTAKFQSHYAGLKPSEQRDFLKSFRGSRFERSRELSKYQNKFANSGMEAANVLNDRDFGLRREFNDITGEKKKVKKRKDPNPGPGNPPPPNPDDRLDRNGNPRPTLDVWGDRLTKWLKASKLRFIRAKRRVKSLFKKGLDKALLNPIKTFLVGADKAGKMSFTKAFGKAFTKNVLFPFKKALLGDDKSVKDVMKTSVLKSISVGFDRTILMPFKKLLVGEERSKQLNFFQSLNTRFNESILTPFKQKLLGTDDKTVAASTSLISSLSARLDKSIVFPLKQALLGSDADKDTVNGTSFIKAVGSRLDKSVLMPLKTALLGGDANKASELNFFQAISKSWADNIVFPMKKALLGGNAARASKLSFMESINKRFQTSILMPMKTLLLGGEKRSQQEVFKTSFLKAVSTGFNERILQPISGLLFGAENKKKGIFNNLGTMMSPFFNKLLFGADKASKGGFIENLKSGSKDLWNSVWSGAKDKFFTPLMGSIKELFGPVFKDFRETMGAELKHFGKTIFGSMSSGIKVGAKGLFKDVFGDETVQLLRDNIIKPLKDLTSKLNDSISKVFKFLIRMPINLLKGVTDSVKIKRMESGRGNYSEEEKARLLNLKRNNKLFNFMDLGPSSSNPNANPSNANGGTKYPKVASNAPPTVNPVINPNNGNGNGGKSDDSTLSDAERKRKNLRDWQDSTRADGNKRKTRYPKLNPLDSEENGDIGRNGLGANGEPSSDTRRNNRRGNSNRIKPLTDPVASLSGRFTPLDISTIVSAASAASRDLPIISKGSTASSDILAFAKQNLTKLDARLENVVKLLRKKNGDVKGVKGSDLSIIRNPFQWIGRKFDGITKYVTKLSGTILGTVGRVVNGLASIPGKIMSSVVTLTTTAFNGLMKVGTSLLDGAAKALSASITFAGNLLDGLGKGLARVAVGVSNAFGAVVEGAGQFLSGVLGPLGKSLGSLTTSIVQGLGPVLASTGKAMASLLDGVRVVASEFGKLAFSLAKNTAMFAGRALGRLTGMTLGFDKEHIATSMSVTNFSQMFSESKLTPLRVIVVDGKIGTYNAKIKRATSFTDKIESRSLLGNKKKIDEVAPKGSFLGSILSGLAGLFMTNPLGKLLMGAGGSLAGGGLLGGIFGKIKGFLGGKSDDGGGDGDSGGKKKGKFGLISKLLGSDAASGKIDDVLGEGASDTITTITDHLGERAEDRANDRAGDRNGPPNDRRERARERLRRMRANRAPRGIFGKLKGFASRVGGGLMSNPSSLGGKLLKGGGIGAVAGIGGGMLADGLFEKGGAMHSMTSAGGEYAGYGAMLGSVVPGVGSMVGAVIGGVIGVVKEALPRLFKWVETKFEKQIRSATDYLIQIPERITAFAAELPNKITEFVQTLPEKITGFLNDLPGTIVRIFAPSTDGAITVDENGNVIEDKPSILGRMFVALGQAVGSIIQAIPKIVVSLIEGMGKLIIAAGSTAATLAAKGIFSVVTGLGDTIAKTFDIMAIKAKNMMPTMLGGTSDEERDAAMKEVDKKYEARAAERSSSLVAISDKGVDITKSLTNWSIADKMKDQGPSEINKNRDAFNKAMTDAGSDTAKGKELFKQRMLALGKSSEDADKEFTLQQGEDATRKAGISSEIDVNNKFHFNTGANIGSSYASYANIDPKTFTTAQVTDAIQKAADYSGIPFKTLDGIANIESSRKYWAVNKSGYKGLFQMGNSEFAKFSPNPTGSPLDPYNNAMAAANYMMYHAKEMKKREIPVTPENLYLAHQQGLGGITTINKAAKAGQADVMSPDIRRNMLNNPPQDGKGKTSNPSEFMSRWASIVNGGAASNGTIGVMAPNTPTSPNAVSMATPGSAGAPAEVAVDEASNALNKYLSAVGNVGTAGNYKFGGQNNKRNLTPSMVSTTPPAGVNMLPESELATATNTQTNVTTNIGTNNQVSSGVQALAEARNAPIAVAVDPVALAISNGMAEQTKILAEIAENTKNAKDNNFFTGGTPAPAPKESGSKVTMSNISNQDIQANFLKGGSQPLMLAPGKGAITLAKAGNSN